MPTDILPLILALALGYLAGSIPFGLILTQAAGLGDIRKVETVFKQGVGYDPIKLIDSVKGKAGIW